ncbi:acetoacetate decarboxylase [Aminobacter ciceronei]|uniref:acetoacetate decarboxylase n=1 Tax=Aminobacter ciceronei TaxID=150723 RepID=UPI0015FD5138
MEASEVKARAFAMPLSSPSYPRGPYRFTDREHLIVTYRTDPTALDLAVPEPLEVGDPLVSLEFMRMEGSTGFGRYSGAAQHISVRFGAQTGAYTHNMFLDVHAPISGGRELWGFPQKLAAPRLVVAHDVLLGTLDYGPERVATATMGYKHIPIADDVALEMLNEPGFLLKIIPHVDGSPRVCELVRYFRRDIVLKGAWTGPAALELHPHALAPLNGLTVLDVVSGVHIVADFTLALGEVVRDYLA